MKIKTLPIPNGAPRRGPSGYKVQIAHMKPGQCVEVNNDLQRKTIYRAMKAMPSWQVRSMKVGDVYRIWRVK
jgi:hypothetical protein